MSSFILDKKKFNNAAKSLISETIRICEGTKLEPVNMWLGKRIPSVFQYGAISERCMEKQLQENGRERKTTFMSDLSIGEWYGARGLFDTVLNVLKSWKDDEEYMAEFLLCLNWKAWEHNARGNSGWAKLYSVLFDSARDLVYEYYENDEEKTAYIYQYLD